MNSEFDSSLPNRKNRGSRKVVNTVASMLLLAACSGDNPHLPATDSKSHMKVVEHQMPEKTKSNPTINPEQIKQTKDQLKAPALVLALGILNGLDNSTHSSEFASSVVLTNRKSVKSSPNLPQIDILYSATEKVLELSATSTSNSLIAGGQIYSSIRSSFRLGTGNPLARSKKFTKEEVFVALSDTENLEVSQLAVANNRPLEYNPDQRFQTGTDVSIYFSPDGHAICTGGTHAKPTSPETEFLALQTDIISISEVLPQLTARMFNPQPENLN